MLPWLRAGERSITYLQGLPWVDRSRIGIFGGSLGAMLGCLITANEPRVVALAEVAGNMPRKEKTGSSTLDLKSYDNLVRRSTGHQ